MLVPAVSYSQHLPKTAPISRVAHWSCSPFKLRCQFWQQHLNPPTDVLGSQQAPSDDIAGCCAGCHGSQGPGLS
ncbi:hypothetical protein GDO78_016155 [Eleutherodactylus coqui]|uniref:Uncharacterized protein n=1 Tax=Eleutherodactylus coqui TaxID=57060 RepID=A0A8J6BDN6_ELECQ|nr:hypothetical protein GDO78_016155 [Eleutherodactylus coqui]